jgi:hypothetical protein
VNTVIWNANNKLNICRKSILIIDGSLENWVMKSSYQFQYLLSCC